MNLNETFKAVRTASRKLAMMDVQTINTVLCAVADKIEEKTDVLLKANQEDLQRMETSNPKYDRLKLTPERLEGIAADMRQVASLPSPLGIVREAYTVPSGLRLQKVSVPFGVIGVIYEARPNVSFDVFSLCLKSGNASILKGGSDADASNRAIVQLIHEVLEEFGIDSHVVELLPSTREATEALLHAEGWVDLIIPRGSSNLIQYVRHEATVPVIETGAGICHTYFDKAGDLTKGAAIVNNAKTRRVSVCNAMDCLLLHRGRLADLPALCAPLAESRVILYADEPAYQALEGNYPAELLQPATLESYGTEFLDYKMAIKTVDVYNIRSKCSRFVSVMKICPKLSPATNFTICSTREASNLSKISSNSNRGTVLPVRFKKSNCASFSATRYVLFCPCEPSLLIGKSPNNMLSSSLCIPRSE